MTINTMEYKGYIALIEYSAEDECLIGHVVGITDRLGFHGESIAEITLAFHNVLDNYLNLCAKTGKVPEQPKSGKLSLRLPAELHAIVAQQSEITGKSVNQMVIDALTSTYLDGLPKATRPTKERTKRKGRATASAK